MNKKDVLIWISVMIVVFLMIFPLDLRFFVAGKSFPLQRNVITVDDEPGDADYTSIKEALDNASPGDTIEVYSGTYYEYYILINKEGSR